MYLVDLNNLLSVINFADARLCEIETMKLAWIYGRVDQPIFFSQHSNFQNLSAILFV